MMQQFKLLGEQLVGIWKQLGLNQRIIVVATGLAVFGGLTGVAYWSSQTRYSVLYTNMDLEEIGTVQNTLETEGISTKLGPRGSTLMVPKEQVYEAKIFLAGKGLPKSGKDSVGYEIFDRPSFGLSNMQQRVNLSRAIQGELERTISSMDGIDAADVFVAMPENKLFVDTQSQASASVFIKTKGLSNVGKEQVRAIQFLVARGVEGLIPERVSVTDNRGKLLSDEENADSMGFTSDRELETRQRWENYYSKQAESMLDPVLGPGNAIVRVSIEFNRDSITRSETIYDSDGIPRSSTETIEKTDSTILPDNGTAGLMGGTNNTNVVAEPGEKKSMERETKENEYALSSTTNDVVMLAGGIKQIMAAVFVAKKKETVDGNVVYTDRDADELQKIERTVSKALGITNTLEQLTVEQMVFHESDELNQLELFHKQQRYNEWMRMGKQIGFLGLTLGVLWAFARSFKQTPMETIPLGVSLEELEEYGEAESGSGNGNGKSGQRKRSSFSIHEPGPPDERIELMNRLIKNHPQNMTHAIQSWLQEENGKSN
jgi:flagellar M-ring protein FliF